MFELQAHKIEEMYRLQDKLNCDTNGANWAKSGITKEGREINWLRCIYMKTAEAIEALNWKHWKDIHAEIDTTELKLLLVDIWHFMISEHIAHCGLTKAMEQAVHDFKHLDQATEGVIDEADTLFFLEEVMKQAPNGVFPYIEFLQAVNQVDDFSMDELYRLYIGKNCLNQFRQDYGYKNGDYKRIWKGQEDNVYMKMALDKDPHLDFDGLYKSLENVYKEVEN